MDKSAAHTSNSGHETAEAHARPLAISGLFMAILLVSVFAGIVVFFKVLDYYQPFLYDDLSNANSHPLAETRSTSPGPRIQIDPPRQKAELREIENVVLTTYDWVDPELGIVRIPIKRAIDILARKKLPTTPSKAQ